MGEVLYHAPIVHETTLREASLETVQRLQRVAQLVAELVGVDQIEHLRVIERVGVVIPPMAHDHGELHAVATVRRCPLDVTVKGRASGRVDEHVAPSHQAEQEGPSVSHFQQSVGTRVREGVVDERIRPGHERSLCGVDALDTELGEEPTDLHIQPSADVWEVRFAVKRHRVDAVLVRAAVVGRELTVEQPPCDREPVV